MEIMTPQFFLYKEMHENQDLEYVLKKKQYYVLNNKMTIRCFKNGYIC